MQIILLDILTKYVFIKTEAFFFFHSFVNYNIGFIEMK